MKKFLPLHLVFIVALIFAIIPANATIHVVSSNAPSGDGTLYNAMVYSSDGDTIVFNLSTGNEIISLQYNYTLDKSLTIIGSNDLGSGVDVTIQPIDPDWYYSPFQIDGGGSNITVKLSRMSIKGGNTTNTAGGGAIRLLEGTLYLDNVTVRDSEAKRGGGISVASSNAIAYISNSTISNNTAAPYYGGGLYCYFGTVYINNTTICNNEAERGGGIYNWSGTLYLINSTVTGNNLPITSDWGGGIYNYGDGEIYCLNSTIVNNTYNSSYSSDIKIASGTTFDAYYCWYARTSGTIGGSNNNTAAYTSGDLSALSYNGGFSNTMPIAAAANYNTKAADGTYAYYNATDGYYFYNGTNYTKIADGSTFTPTAPADDKILTDQRGYYRIDGAVYTGNLPSVETADITRGACQYFGIVAREGGTWASGGDYYTKIKGAAERESSGTINLSGTAIYEYGTEFNDNETLIIKGEGALSTIVQADTAPNIATDRVFHVSDGIITFEDMTIRNGKKNNGGGGIFAENNSTVNMNRVAVNNNYISSLNGGGFYFQSADGSITDCSFKGNLSMAYGGGGAITGGTVNITNSTFSDNNAAYAGGLALLVGTFDVKFTTIANNSASDASYAGGLMLADADLSISNTMIANNESDETDFDFRYIGQLDPNFNDNGYNIVEYSTDYTWEATGDITGPQTNLFGTGLATQSLAYNGGETPTLAIETGSVAAGAGNYDATVTTDQRGVTRIDPPTIGAFELGETTPSVTTEEITTYSVTTATMGGNVTADGNSTVTERGVVYSSTDSEPEIDDPGVTKDPNGSGTGMFSESISGLSSNTLYYVQAYAINDLGTSYGGVESFTTKTTPSTQASSVNFSSTTCAGTTVGWTRGNGENCAVFIKETTTGEAAPVDGTSYTANTSYGDGDEAGTGWYCIYNGTGTSVSVTGLSSGTTYRVHACEYNGGSSHELYNTNTATSNPANQATLSAFSAGTILATGETICYNGDPSEIGSSAAASGGDETITYQWQYSTDNFATVTNTISSSNSASYNPPENLTESRWYRRQAHDATCQTTFTNSTGVWEVTVRSDFSAGEIKTTGEIVCYNSTPTDEIGSESDASGGDGSYTYQWQYSTDNFQTMSSTIDNSNVSTYTPTSSLTQDTWYRRQAHDGTCNTTFETSAEVWKVSVRSDFSPGEITTTGETICYNSTPNDEIGSESDASGGDEDYTYRWQSSNDEAFTSPVIINTDAATYTPTSALPQNTWYRRQAHDGECNTTFETSAEVWKVSVRSDFSAGEITTTGETVCYNSTPNDEIGSESDASGGDEDYTYRWQSSTDENFTSPVIINTDAATYTPTNALTQDTWYRRQAHDGTCNTTFETSTEVWKVTVYDEFMVGSISEDQTICSNSTPNELTGIAPTGGNTPYTYQWQSSNDNINFSNITGATSINYQPGVLTDTTYYRQQQTSASGCGTLTTNTVTIVVHNLCCNDEDNVCQGPYPIQGTSYISDEKSGKKIFDNFFNIVGGVTAIEWWGSTVDAGDYCDENPKNFTIEFYTDNNGSVGTLYKTCSASVTGTNTGATYGDNDIPIMNYVYTLSQPFSGLQNGWVAIYGDPVGSCDFTWINSEYGDGKSYQEGSKAPLTVDFAFGLETDPSIPINDWALYLGLILMGMVVVVRFYRR